VEGNGVLLRTVKSSIWATLLRSFNMNETLVESSILSSGTQGIFLLRAIFTANYDAWRSALCWYAKALRPAGFFTRGGTMLLPMGHPSVGIPTGESLLHLQYYSSFE